MSALLQVTRVDSVDLASSCMFVCDGTRRRRRANRAAWLDIAPGRMAVVPEARRSEIGRAVMHHLLGKAKARRDRRMVLE
jgi:GNAT superfamily N-acetyltransferase